MKKGLFFVAVIIMAASCSTTRYMTAGVSPAEIEEVARFEAISRISLIEKSNTMVHSDSLSVDAAERLDEIISARSPFVLLPEEIAFADTAEIRLIEEDLLVMARTADGLMSSGSKKKRTMPIYVTHRVDSILSAYGVTRTMLTLHEGFTRTKGNMTGQTMKGVGLGVLTAVATMGAVSVYTTPVKSTSSVYVFIIDNEQKQVIFYDKSVLNDEPNKERVLTRQVDKIFKEL